MPQSLSVAEIGVGTVGSHGAEQALSLLSECPEMRDIVIYGAGGFGREVLQVVHAINRVASTWRCLGFVVDSSDSGPKTMHDLPVFRGVEAVPDRSRVWFSIGIGDPTARSRLADELAFAETAGFAVLVHPMAWVGDRVELSAGCVICAGVMITTDIILGEHVHVNLCATIGHDTVIDKCATISPGVNISGRAKIGARVEIGTAASVIPGVEISDDCVVGAGAAVVRSLPAGATAVGAPAQVTRVRDTCCSPCGSR